MALHVVELDGEAIGGTGELVFGEEQRRGAALFAPPAERLRGRGQLARRQLAEHAQNVEIGKAGVMIAGGGRAVEHHRYQPLAEGLLQFSTS